MSWLPGPQVVGPGQAANYSLVITNTGNIEAVVQLSITPTPLVPFSLPLAQVTVPAHGSLVQPVAVQPATPGLYTLLASADDGVVQAQASTTLEVTGQTTGLVFIPLVMGQGTASFAVSVYVPIVIRSEP